jgi:MoaA/NifB/PqqE/SkfB family radical SAM enzyme
LILARARRRGLSINMNTNGLLVPKQLGTVRLADKVVISIDGPEEVHDRVRGHGSFRGAMKGADAARAAGLPVSFYTVLGKSNLLHLDRLVRMAEERKSRVFFQPGSKTILGSGGGENKDAADTDAYRNGVDALIAWKRAGRPVGNSHAGLQYIRMWPEPNPIRCMGGRLFARIDADGHVRPCGRVPRGADNFVFRDGGIVGAMSRIAEPDCSACYSAARSEVNLMAGGKPAAVLEFLRR